LAQFNSSYTLSDVQQEVIQLTKEPQPLNPVFATLANVTVYANEAQLKINSRTLCRIKSNLPNNYNQDPTMNTVSGQRLYALPDDFMSMVKLSVNRIRIGPAKFDDFADNVQWWKLPGFPTGYYFERDATSNTLYFGLFPTPLNVYPIGLIYVPQPIKMSAATDVVDLDPRLCPAVVKYVCWKIMEYRREESRANYWRGQYEEEIAQYEAAPQETAEPMPFNNTPVPSD